MRRLTRLPESTMLSGLRPQQPKIPRLAARTIVNRHPDPARELPSMFPSSLAQLVLRLRQLFQKSVRQDKRRSSPMTPPLSAVIENTKWHPPSDRRPRRSDASMSSAAPENERSAPLQIARTRSESPSPPPERPAAIHTPGAPGASTIRSARPASPALTVTSSASRSEEARPIVHAKEITRKAAADRHDVRRGVDELSSDRKPGRHQEPTVAVTIGRVEVRAVMEPPKAPPKTRRVATNGMSLDDYLKRHEEKRR